MIQHPFPGNVRELSHAVEHAMVLSGGRQIDLAHLPPSFGGTASAERMLPSQPAVLRPLHLAVRDFELEYLRGALEATDGKRNRAAEMLGISRKTLWEKLRHTGSSGGARPSGEEVEHEA
jgi:DNA-binding NtrC family response regulator